MELHEDDLALATGVRQLLLRPVPLDASLVEVGQVRAAGRLVLPAGVVVLRIGARPAVLLAGRLLVVGIVVRGIVRLTVGAVQRDHRDRPVVDAVVVVPVRRRAVVRGIEVRVVLLPASHHRRTILRCAVAAVQRPVVLPVPQGGEDRPGRQAAAQLPRVVPEELVPARLVPATLNEIPWHHHEVRVAVLDHLEVAPIALVLGQHVTQRADLRQHRGAERLVPHASLVRDRPVHPVVGQRTWGPFAPLDPASRLRLRVGQCDEPDVLPAVGARCRREARAVPRRPHRHGIDIVPARSQAGHIDGVLVVLPVMQPGPGLQPVDLLGEFSFGVLERRLVSRLRDVFGTAAQAGSADDELAGIGGGGEPGDRHGVGCRVLQVRVDPELGLRFRAGPRRQRRHQHCHHRSE